MNGDRRLPSGFSVVPGTSQVDGAVVADPAQTGSDFAYADGVVDVPAGTAATLTLDVDVPIGTAPGLYTAALETWMQDDGVGRTVEDELSEAAPLLVGIDRSGPPVVDDPILDGDTRVDGASFGGAGATIRVQVNGNPAAETVSGAGGAWAADVPTLFVGQEVTATAQAPGEIESVRSAPVTVRGLAGESACANGEDDDGDGLVDLEDPGCDDGLDADETDETACANGQDDDGDGLTDFPADPSCSGFDDDDESGPPACANGADDDGDGLVDLDDPDCADAGGVTERHVPACANGLDDDTDGAEDFPLDPGCDDAADDDEVDLPGGDGGDADSDADTDGDSDAGTGTDAGAGPDRPDHGGLPGPGSGTFVGTGGGGCDCRVAGESRPIGAFFVALLLLAARLRRREPSCRRR